MDSPPPKPTDAAPQKFKLSGLIFPVFLPQFLISLVVGLTLPTLPLIGGSLLGNDFYAALPVTMRYLGNSVWDIPTSALISYLGSRLVGAIGIVLLIVAALLIIVFPNYATLIVSRVIEGMGFGMWLVSRHTLLATAVPNRSRGSAGSIIGGLLRGGMLFGALAGGFIAAGTIPIPAFFGLEDLLYAPFYFQFAISILTLLIFVVSAPKDANVRVNLRQLPGAFKETLQQNLKNLVLVSIVAVTVHIMRGVREIVIPIVGNNIGLDVAQIGIVQALSGVIDVVLFPFAGYTMDKFGRKLNGIPTMLLFAIGLGLFGFITEPWMLYVLAVVVGIANGANSGMVLTIAGDLAPKNHPSEFTGIWRTIADTGHGMGPFIAGGISTIFSSLIVSSLVVAGIGLFGTAVFMFFIPETLEKPPPKRDD